MKKTQFNPPQTSHHHHNPVPGVQGALTSLLCLGESADSARADTKVHAGCRQLLRRSGLADAAVFIQ